MTADLRFTDVTPAHADALAALHATAFDRPWSAQAFADLLGQPTVSGWVATAASPVGFILMRLALDEVEILTLAVAPAFRRRGYGQQLVSAALDWARTAGAKVCHLEVAANNGAAVALYRGLGFNTQGRRPDYYGTAERRIDAILMTCALTSQEHVKTKLDHLN